MNVMQTIALSDKVLRQPQNQTPYTVGTMKLVVRQSSTWRPD